MKQYIVEEAYSGNDKVSKYVDGECVGWDIMNDYNTTGYCKALEGEGYEKAFDLEVFQKRVDRAYRPCYGDKPTCGYSGHGIL